MTNAFLAEFDAIATAAFADAGMADAAQFVALPLATPIPCTVYVDRGMQDVGEMAISKNSLVTITAFRAEIPMPSINVSEFVIGAEAFVVADIAANSDESRIVCIVRPK